jgi:hypothetical protein
MSVIGHSPLAGASGAAGGGGFEGLYVDDLFSTFLYTGDNNSAVTVNNGIDLSGEGGLVWFKNRDTAQVHILQDTANGTSKYLSSSSTSPATSISTGITSFNSNGFAVGSTLSYLTSKYVSWTFRKQSKFFDVVTYNGTGSAQNISHSLGSVPGMIMIHCLDGTHDWEVYHRSTGATKSLHLNRSDAATTDSTVWNNTTPTSSVFTVGTSSNVNQNGHGYVAYVFAHDEQSFGTNGDEAIIKCGIYTESSSAQEIDLGFEPQFLLYKGASAAGNWRLRDVMRGMSVTSGVQLEADSAQQEGVENKFLPTSTGFIAPNLWYGSGVELIYMAIRRSHKPPTAGTQVFAAQASRSSADGTPSNLTYTSNFPVDLMFNLGRTGNSLNMVAVDRLRGESRYLSTSAESAESSSGPWKLDTNAGVYLNGNFGATSAHGGLMFRRAAGFFDVVNYTGDGTYDGSKTVNHNLGVAPEMIINKSRTTTNSWNTYHTAIGNTYIIRFNNSGRTGIGQNFNPTATTFDPLYAGNAIYSSNTSGVDYISYLFATLDGISKVSSYTGTGSDLNVDCSFTAGARFVLIKRTDGSGDWYFWDSARGIVSGNDPYLLLNSTAAEVTNTDYIDPLNAGFTVTSSAPTALNASGGTYLFLAIA